MAKIQFRDLDGRPAAGAVTIITASPVEMPEIGYVTAGDGSITLTVPAAGTYDFLLTGHGAERLRARAQLSPGKDAQVTARPEA